jgi:hypothetical protein
VVGSYAYVADWDAGLQVIDISNPTNLVHAGSCDTSGPAAAVRVVGTYAYVAAREAGLQVIDVSHPASCIRVTGYNTSGYATGVHTSENRIYVADGPDGLLVLYSVPNLLFTFQVDATPDAPFTIEAAPSLTAPLQWTPLLTTNSATMPFYFTDLDVPGGKKFYRVVEP